MIRILKHKKLLFAALSAVIISLVAWLPVYGRKSIFQYMINFIPGERQMPEAKKELPNEPAGKLWKDEVWQEIEKITAGNQEDTLTLEGKIRLYDNLDDAGIREQQHFILQRTGEDQRFSLEIFENIHVGHQLVL